MKPEQPNAQGQGPDDERPARGKQDPKPPKNEDRTPRTGEWRDRIVKK